MSDLKKQQGGPAGGTESPPAPEKKPEPVRPYKVNVNNASKPKVIKDGKPVKEEKQGGPAGGTESPSAPEKGGK